MLMWFNFNGWTKNLACGKPSEMKQNLNHFFVWEKTLVPLHRPSLSTPLPPPSPPTSIPVPLVFPQRAAGAQVQR